MLTKTSLRLFYLKSICFSIFNYIFCKYFYSYLHLLIFRKYSHLYLYLHSKKLKYTSLELSSRWTRPTCSWTRPTRSASTRRTSRTMRTSSWSTAWVSRRRWICSGTSRRCMRCRWLRPPSQGFCPRQKAPAKRRYNKNVELLVEEFELNSLVGSLFFFTVYTS